MTRKQIPTTYDEARAALKGRSSRTIANNTTLIDLGPDGIGLRLHSTVVVTFKADGRILLNTGGWHSGTTKDRLNRVALAHGYRVFSEKYEWKVARFGAWKQAVDFEEGFTLNGASAQKVG